MKWEVTISHQNTARHSARTATAHSKRICLQRDKPPLSLGGSHKIHEGPPGQEQKEVESGRVSFLNLNDRKDHREKNTIAVVYLVTRNYAVPG